jgi:hypothetical protein
MATRAVTRAAALLLMAPAGTRVEPLVAAWVTACAPRYHNLYTVAGDDVWSLTRDALCRTRRAADVLAHGVVRMPMPAVDELRARGAALHKLLAAPMDFYVAGDAHALRVLARLTLWQQECGARPTIMFLPCCPYNSVPFTFLSSGFPGALTESVHVTRAMLHSRWRDRRRAPIGIVRILGDNPGWLSAGAAGLASDSSVVFCLTAATCLDPLQFLTCLRKQYAKQHAVTIVIGDDVCDAQRRPLAPTAAALAPAVQELIRVHTRLSSELITLHPGVLTTGAVPAAERALAAKVVRAAVQHARRAGGAVLIANRQVAPPARIAPCAVPLLETVTTPRRVPAAYLRPAAFRATDVCREALAAFVSPAVAVSS